MSYKPDYSATNDRQNPKYNPLKHYRTYSYHFVLMVANETGFVDMINSEVGRGIDVYKHPDIKGTGERFTIQKIGSYEYVVLVNTMTDSYVSINDVEYHTLFGGTSFDSPSSTNLLFGNELRMNIVEPYGTRFIEFFLGACNNLGVDQAQAIIVLKTIFVGHKDTGEVETLTNFQAYPFIFQDIGFTFMSSGTMYAIQGIPLTNGLGNLPSISTIGGRPFLVEGFTLKNFIESLNKHLKEEVIKAEEEIKAKQQNNTILRYRIQLEGDYNNDDYIITDHPEQEKSKNKKWSTSLSQDADIRKEIIRIFGFCEKVRNEAKNLKYDNEGVAIAYAPWIGSTVEQKKENGKIYTTIVYTVKKRKQIVFRNEETKRRKIEVSATREKSKVKFDNFLGEQLSKGNLIEFDYIFSGKNDDVLRYDMLFEFGLGALYNRATPKQPIDQKDQVGTNPTPTTDQIKQKNSVSPNSSQLLFLPYTFSNPLKQPGAYDEFQNLLRRYATFETLTSQIEILGNPRLFAPVLNTLEQMNEKNQPGIIIPYFAKINVFMPRVDPKTGFVDFKNGIYEPERGFKSPFWYDGIFTLQEIHNKFSNGKFTQTLVLFQAISDKSVAEQGVIEEAWKSSSAELFGEKATTSDIKGGNAVSSTGTQPRHPTSKCDSRNVIQIPNNLPGGTDGGTGSKNVQAFLKTIRICEGTYPASKDEDYGYRRIVKGFSVSSNHHLYRYNIDGLNSGFVVEDAGGSRGGLKNRYFKDYRAYKSNGHPRFYVYYNEKLEAQGKSPSSAAGAYQFTYQTWERLGFKTMTPENQDKAAVKLIQENRALQDVKKGNIKSAIEKLKGVWISLGPSEYTARSVENPNPQNYVCPDIIIQIFEANGGKVGVEQ